MMLLLLCPPTALSPSAARLLTVGTQRQTVVLATIRAVEARLGLLHGWRRPITGLRTLRIPRTAVVRVLRATVLSPDHRFVARRQSALELGADAQSD